MEYGVGERFDMGPRCASQTLLMEGPIAVAAHTVGLGDLTRGELAAVHTVRGFVLLCIAPKYCSHHN